MGNDTPSKPAPSFEIGEPVEVIDGPFDRFSGVVESVDPDGLELRVMVTIFGRQTPVELDYVQVRKL